MSINVTVTGNPVSIKRGKMITSDPQAAKKDFDKRRLLRLEQVRQQSKELAEDVRNKVRKEKKRHLGQIEQEGKVRQRNWQNRKLLELQNQYLDALDEIGLGHNNAKELADEDEILEKQRLQSEEIAKNRGRLADTKLQVQKNEESYKKAMPIQHKKLVRDIENTRAALVSSMKNKVPKKNVKPCPAKAKKSKPTANINITVPNDSDFSEASSSDSSKHLPSIQEEHKEESEGFCECTGSSEDSSGSSDPDAEELVDDHAVSKENVSCQVGRGDLQPTKQPVPKPDVASRLPSQQELELKKRGHLIDGRSKLIDEIRNGPREAPRDTRISDRIKRRQFMASQPDYCDLITDPTPILEVEESTKIRDKISGRSDNRFGPTDGPFARDPLELSDECMCTKFHNACPCRSKNAEASASKLAAVQTDSAPGYRKACKCKPKGKSDTKPSKGMTKEQIGKAKGGEGVLRHLKPDTSSSQRVGNKFPGPPKEIPIKPAVKLKDVERSGSKTDSGPASVQGTVNASSSSGAYRVPHYDHPNRFVRDLPSTTRVEKIEADSIEVIPNITSESEWHEKMKQRDKDAQVRGKRALEKERIQRDYEEMMKKLPMLQRKEHVAQIGTDKPEYHMSEERLKERERERQNRLENAYLQAVPELKPQIVTLPSRKHEIPRTDEPFEILDGDDSRALNLGKWDTDTKPRTMFSAEEVQEIIKAFTVQKPEDRKAKLKQLLKSLKLQKEQLINEIRALPRDDSINALISDLTSFSDADEKHHRAERHRHSDRKRRLEESDTSSASTEVSAARDKTSKSKARHKDKHGRSPYKKLKKPVPRVLVLQNMSTQTTPKATKEKSSTTTSTTTTSSGVQVSDPPAQAESDGIRICTKTHVPCDCYKGKEAESSEEVCKIYIKLNEEETPRVEVVRSARDLPGRRDDGGGSKPEAMEKSPRIEKERTSSSPRKAKHSQSPGKENKSPKRVETKSVATETEPFKKPVTSGAKKIKSTTRRGPQLKGQSSSSRNKVESWKEQLSKNSMSTSSTSYMSPPDFSRPNTTASTDVSKQSFYNLRKKPQQTNIDGSSIQFSHDQDPNRDRRLLRYIKQLLSMSKTSVDDLGVSSSDVQTPSQSVIEMESNNPMAALHNMIRLINFKAADAAKGFTSSVDYPKVPPNSSVDSVGSGSNLEKEASPQILVKDTNDDNSTDKTKVSLLSRYADVTDSCSKRIANLAVMIEQLRKEKIQMLQSPPTLVENPTRPCDPLCSPRSIDLARLTPTFSDKDNSTKYYEFPPSDEKSKGTNSTASMDEEELNKRLLEIDMSLAEKLKRFRQIKNEKSADNSDKAVQDQKHDATPPAAEDQLDQTNQQFLLRLQRLIEESHEREQPEPESPLPVVNTQVPFLPFLVDIPKLPILEPEPEESSGGQEKRHPPPSKGLFTAKKFNGDISLMPHELSTIIEADSQLSTRISPNNSRTCASLGKDSAPPLSPTIEERSLSTDKSSVKPGDKSSRSQKSMTRSDKVVEASDSLTCNEGTCTSLALSSSSSKHSSSSSPSDMKSIEDMLKSIGMDWAIPTLHKTQEALALTSTSSSGDLSMKQRSGRRSTSSSEVSLKDFLKKQMISKISSSSLNRSDASPASFVRECSEISAIQANSSTEKAKQRTSTPVLTSKSTVSKSKEEQHQLFNGASDISTVRSGSCEGSCNKSSEKQTFHSLCSADNSSPTKSSVE